MTTASLPAESPSPTFSGLRRDFSLETTAKGATHFVDAMRLLPVGTPVNLAFIGKETPDQRIGAIRALYAAGCNPRPILSARRLASEEALVSYLDRAREAGCIQGVFLVGGDPSSPSGPFVDALDLINHRVFARPTFATVGIAGYPEGHPAIRDAVLRDVLRRKVDLLKARGFRVEITTQLAFNVDAVVAWIESVRRAGIDVPIRVSIPSPSTIAGLLRFASLCRVSTSARALQNLGWSATSLIGSEGPDRFLSALHRHSNHRQLGQVKLHIYPMSSLASVLQWIQQ